MEPSGERPVGCAYIQRKYNFPRTCELENHHGSPYLHDDDFTWNNRYPHGVQPHQRRDNYLHKQSPLSAGQQHNSTEAIL